MGYFHFLINSERLRDTAAPRCFGALGCLTWSARSLQFSAFGLLSLFVLFFRVLRHAFSSHSTLRFCCVLYVWVARLGCHPHIFSVRVAQFESESCVPRVTFRGDFGARESIFHRFLVTLGCRRALRQPLGPYLAPKAEKVPKRSGK